MNTTISVGSKKFTFRLEILLLIIFLLWLLWGHLLCSCAQITLSEGFQLATSVANKIV
jgi:hypothetical protein